MSGSGSYPDPFVQIVYPDTTVQDEAGYCHRMARAVFNAPWVSGLDSATKAANATWWRYETRDMPNVAVPVWFDHWGTYGGVFGNWGHVVVWVPGHGFLSSPWYKKYGQEWYPTIEDVERTFNATFRFWTEDINGLRVAEQESEDIVAISDDDINRIVWGIMTHPISREGSDVDGNPQVGETNPRAVFAWTDALFSYAVSETRKAKVEVVSKLEEVQNTLLNAIERGVEVDPEVIKDAIAQALADKQLPSAAEIAKTVNDDVSKRMSA